MHHAPVCMLVCIKQLLPHRLPLLLLQAGTPLLDARTSLLLLLLLLLQDGVQVLQAAPAVLRAGSRTRLLLLLLLGHEPRQLNAAGPCAVQPLQLLRPAAAAVACQARQRQKVGAQAGAVNERH